MNDVSPYRIRVVSDTCIVSVLHCIQPSTSVFGVGGFAHSLIFPNAHKDELSSHIKSKWKVMYIFKGLKSFHNADRASVLKCLLSTQTFFS